LQTETFRALEHKANGLSLEVKMERDKWSGDVEKRKQLEKDMGELLDQVEERHKYIGVLMEAVSRISATPPGSPRKRT
jgi:hypothetical protein